MRAAFAAHNHTTIPSGGLNHTNTAGGDLNHTNTADGGLNHTTTAGGGLNHTTTAGGVPGTATTQINKLQVTQNIALRIATGCTQTTPIPHLHRETQLLLLKQHMLMRGTHIYTSTDCPTHPLHHLRSAPARRQRPRPPRTTVAKLYQQELDSLPPTPDNTILRTHTYTPSTLTEHLKHTQ